jgi:hypothetical protein
LKVAPFPAQAEQARERAEAAGCVLGFVRFERDDDESPAEAAHRQAACSAVVETYERWRDSLDDDTVAALGRWGTARLRRRLERRAARAAWVDASTIAGRRISRREFFGPGRDGERLVSLVEWSGAHAPPDELDFTYAFCQPPYGLRPGLEDVEVLFAAVVQHVLGDPDDRTEIWSWSTSWSEYFDDGREWWGTGLWTVDVAGAIVVILASATD